jgi:hypothetical protein
MPFEGLTKNSKDNGHDPQFNAKAPKTKVSIFYFLLVSLFLLFSCPLSSSQLIENAAVLKNPSSISITYHSHQMNVVNYDGSPQLTTFAWNELIFRLYSMSDNGYIDEANVEMIFLPECSLL